jgi:hypothetical protein
MLYFEIDVVFVGPRANFHFLDRARSRALFRIVSLLLERVAILVEVGDAADRRLRGGSNLDQVESLGFRDANGFANGQNADL